MKLSKAHRGAWAGLLFVHSRLVRQINARLAEADAVSLDVYDLLLMLEESPKRRLRMSELAERVLLSRSGMTRFVDRLEKDGLIRREPDEADRRAMYAVLTKKGLKERERAWPPYSKALQEYFAPVLSEEEAGQLAQTLKRFIPNDDPAGKIVRTFMPK